MSNEICYFLPLKNYLCLFKMKLYQTVIEDTINSSREFFAEEGIDDQILMELRQSWESKVMASKAVDAPPPQEVTQLPKTVSSTVVKQNKSQYTPTIVSEYYTFKIIHLYFLEYLQNYIYYFKLIV